MMIKLSDVQKKLANSIISIGSVYAFNIVIPLVSFPYIIRTIGLERFGVITIAAVIVSYFSLFIDYGFNTSATRDISLYRNNPRKLNEIFNAVILIKLVLATASFVIFFTLILTVEKFRTWGELYFITFGMIIGQVLLPIWFYQGVEEMKILAKINIVIKTIFTALIFFFVRGEDDYLMIPALATLSSLLIGLWGFLYIKIKYRLETFLPRFIEMKRLIIEGFHIFLSTIAINGYKNNTVLALSFLASPAMVGSFSMAKKIFDALNGSNMIISQAFFPHIVSTQKDNPLKVGKGLKDLFKICLVSSSLIAVFTIVFSSQIVRIISGFNVGDATNALQILSIGLVFIGLNIPAVHYLLQQKEDKFYSRAVIFGVMIDLVFIALLIPTLKIQGAAISVLLTEIIVTLLLYYFSLKRYHEKRKI